MKYKLTDNQFDAALFIISLICMFTTVYIVRHWSTSAFLLNFTVAPILIALITAYDRGLFDRKQQ